MFDVKFTAKYNNLETCHYFKLMHFWLDVPFPSVTGLFKTRSIFTPRLRTLPNTTTPSLRVRLATELEIPDLKKFLKTFFGQPPARPSLCPKLAPSSSEIILTVSKQTHDRILYPSTLGTIRYRIAPTLFLPSATHINVIDCFCVHPDYQKIGIGTTLLSYLHQITMDIGEKYSIFLKEGAPIFAPVPPLYSSSYVYRMIQPSPVSLNTRPISHKYAIAMVKIYCNILTDTFALIPTAPSSSTHWILWHQSGSVQWLLAVFQDAFQEHPQGGRIYTLSGVIAALSVIETPILYQQALEKTIDTLAQTVAPDAKWIWADKALIRIVEESNLWKSDGPFHWYAYQWDTVLKPTSRGYILCV